MGTLRLPSLRTPGPLAGADPQVGALVGLIASGTLLLTLAAVLVVGVIGLVLPLAVAGLLACIRWPALPVGLMLFLSLVIDNVVGAAKGPGAQIYSGIGGFSPFELLVYLSVGCVTLDCVRRRRLPPVPWLVALGLLLLLVAFVAGSVVGYASGAGLGAQFDGWRNVLPTIVAVPLVVAVLPVGRPLRIVVVAVAVLIAIKACEALLLTARGGLGIEGIVFYEPTANWLFLLYMLVVVACRVRSVPLPWWVWAAMPIVTLAFIVGLKRSLWLGGVVGIAVVFVLGLSRLGRRLALPAILVTGVLGWVLISAGVSSPLGGPVAERVSSLNPTAISANAQDRYRLDERANVWAAIKDTPVAGLGQGVQWRAVYPLGIEHEDARNYVHFAVLWFWMKYSLLGAIGYVAYLLGTALVGVRVARRHPDPAMAAVGLGILAAVVSLAVAELTVTWTGADARFSLIFGAAIGVLCVMDRERAGAEARRARGPAAADAAAGP